MEIGSTSEMVFWTALVVFTLGVLLELWMRQITAREKTHEKPHSKRVDSALRHLKHAGTKRVTNDLWQEITGVSHATATRDLGELEDMGVLKKKGRGRGVHYIFVKHEGKNN
ncbi:MAG: hypothetical protein WDZ40_01880 [Candidatus Spechtbacterales bacterium]